MKKLKLRLDDLRIDSFHADAEEQGKGTVFGEQCSCDTVCTCPGLSYEPTCPASCYGTCDYLDPSCVYTNCFGRVVHPEFCR